MGGTGEPEEDWDRFFPARAEAFMVNVAENPSIDAQNEPASDHTKKKQRRHLKLL